MQAADIEKYLSQLGEELQARGIEQPLHLLMIGGAFMLLLAHSARSTDDVDFFWLDGNDQTLEQAISLWHESVQAVEAFAAFEQAILHDSYDASLYCLKGQSLMHQYKNKELEAINAFEHAIQLDPYNASAYCYKGIVLRWIGHRDEALAMYDRAIELAPNGAWVYHNKAIYLKELGRYEEALQFYRYIVELQPEDVDAWAEMWDALRSLAWQKGDKALSIEADRAFSKTMQLGGHSLIAVNTYDCSDYDDEFYDEDDSCGEDELDK